MPSARVRCGLMSRDVAYMIEGLAGPGRSSLGELYPLVSFSGGVSAVRNPAFASIAKWVPIEWTITRGIDGRCCIRNGMGTDCPARGALLILAL